MLEPFGSKKGSKVLEPCAKPYKVVGRRSEKDISEWRYVSKIFRASSNLHLGAPKNTPSKILYTIQIEATRKALMECS